MPNTLFTGKVYLRFDELGSTNDYAAQWLAEGNKGAAKSKPPEGSVVRADRQSAGRGQFGSPWESAPGENLTLSIILYPTWLDVRQQFYLSMSTALAVYDTVSQLLTKAPDIKIKWPNDLYAGERKLAGILIQNAISGKDLQSSIVGIGLNVNQLQFTSDAPNPGSLALESGRSFDLEPVSDLLLDCFERRYLQLKAGRQQELQEEYESLLYRLAAPARYLRISTNEPFTGMIRGVTPEGLLRMDTGAAEETFAIKALRFI